MRHTACRLVAATLLAAACSNGTAERSAQEPSPGRADPRPTTTIDSPDDLRPPVGTSEAAATLARVEQALRSPDTRAEEVPRLAWEQQLAYRTVLARPDWAPAVVAAVPPGVRGVVDTILQAGRTLAGLTGAQRGLPDWRIEAPPPPEELLGYYREAETASGIPWPYLAAIHFVETRMGRIRGTSPAGAQGPMQFIPDTWEAYGRGSIDNSRDAILAAGRYLDHHHGPEDMNRALFAYNPSLRYVDAVTRYAHLMREGGERVYRAFYHWQVYYATTEGVALLPEGYPARPAVFTNR